MGRRGEKKKKKRSIAVKFDEEGREEDKISKEGIRISVVVEEMVEGRGKKRGPVN